LPDKLPAWHRRAGSGPFRNRPAVPPDVFNETNPHATRNNLKPKNFWGMAGVLDARLRSILAYTDQSQYILQESCPDMAHNGMANVVSSMTASGQTHPVVMNFSGGAFL
jgi:hypothetical protein